MDFGIGLKENIEFTKLSNAELEKLTETERAEYEARKAQYEEIEKYNQSVSEAVSAEEKFQIALDNCTTEQERQALITSALNTLYGEASDKYKETNADVIAANKANEAWTESLAEVGTAVEPLLTTVKELGAALLRLLVPVIETIVNNLPIIGVGLAGVTAATIAFKISAIAATAATKGMTLAQYAAAAAQGVLNAVMSANPIGLIILGITALVAAVMAMVKHWEGFSEFFVGMWSSIKKTFTATVDGIKEAWQSLLKLLKDPLAGALQSCMNHFNSFRQSVESVFSKIREAVNGFVENMKTLPGKIWSAISGAVTKVAEWGANMVAKAKSSIDKMVTTVVNKLKELPAKVVSIGGDLVDGLWKGVSDKLSWLKKKLSSFATSVLDGIKDFFGVHSPSTETAWIGKMLDEGMALGVEKNAEAPIKAMDRLSSEMLSTASGGGDITLERRISLTFGATEPANAFADGLSSKLDQIYKAILSGKVIMLDGKTLVGSTVARYDNELGQRRVLAERGAL
jgi:phage-related protein